MTALHTNRFFGRRLLPVLLALLALSPVRAEDGLSKSDISKLANQYIRTVEKRDFAAWRELLAPLHQRAEELNEEFFLDQTQGIKSLSIGKIDGLNVELKIKTFSGILSSGILQLEPAGRIKYTPFCFRHPLYTVCAELQPLLDDRQTLMGSTTSPNSRQDTVYVLECLRIPMFDYDPLATDTEDRRADARKILEWLEENGAQYDATGPKVPIPPSEFDRLMDRLRTAAE
jgi:hypothetical protein